MCSRSCSRQGAWARANADEVQVLSYTLPPPDTAPDHFPQFAIVKDAEAKLEAFFDLAPGAPHQIDKLPSLREINEYKRIKADPTYRWSMRMYDRLMKGFNALHERIYQTHKDRVNGKNDIIEEVAKLLFLESFRLHHDGGTLIFDHNGQQLNLKDVFTAAHVRAHEASAVAEIQSAFEHFKLHQDYVVTDDAGEQHPIFDKNVHLRLAQPGNYEAILSLIQDLGPVTDDQRRLVKEHGTLADIAADVLGRAFDVFLRANFESKGGLGIYLTPAPVKQAMLSLAFHDIKESTEDLANLVARDGKGRPAFRFCDPACGSGGFLSVAFSHLRRALDEIGGKATASDEARKKLFAEMCEHSFVGADSSPQMVMLARVNMALLGAPKARIFYTQNSLTSPQLQAGTFDLICTNPPFGTPKFNKVSTRRRKRTRRR
jgi:type I restriction enzyme M protein